MMNEEHENALAQHVGSYLPDYVADRLPPVRRTEVEAHLRGCTACQRECDEWRMLASAVRSSAAETTSTTPFARAWNDLRSRLPARASTFAADEGMFSDQMSDNNSTNDAIDSGDSGDSEGATAPSLRLVVNTQPTRRAIIRRIVVIAALIALVISGFAVVFHQAGGVRRLAGTTTTPGTPTSTLASTPSLTWVDSTMPPISAGYAPISPGFAGDVAYTCSFSQNTPNARIAVWRSEDRAQTWTRVADVPFTHGEIDSCAVMGDQVDTRIAVIAIGWGRADAATHKVTFGSHFVSIDAGASWRETTIAQDQSWQALATFGGQSFFILPATGILMVSDDGLKTARPAETPPIAPGDIIVHLWMEPTHGQLLLEIRSQSDFSSGALWRSDDRGQSWRAVPQYAPLLSQITVGAPRADADWSVCGAPSNGDNGESLKAMQRLEIVCSVDGGISWRKINGLTGDRSFGIGNIIGIAHDGAVFGSIQVMQDQKIKSTTLYWLSPGATEWQILESQQDLTLDFFMFPAGAHDVLWRTILVQTADGDVTHFASAVY